MVPSASVPLPMIVTLLVGRLTSLSAPAFATGAWLTVTWTISVEDAPLLSVTVNWNW